MNPHANVRRILSQYAAVTVTNTANETSLLSPSMRGSPVLQAGMLSMRGRDFRVRARGFYSASGARTLRIRLKLTDAGVPTTLLLDTGVIVGAFLGAAVNYSWQLDADVVCFTPGAAGSLYGQGVAHFVVQQGSLGAAPQLFGMPLTAPVAMKLDGALTLDLTAQWGAANAAESISCTGLTAELLS